MENKQIIQITIITGILLLIMSPIASASIVRGFKQMRYSGDIMINGTDSLNLFVNDQSRLYITNIGNIGLNTTVPTERLVVMGNLSVNSSDVGTSALFVDSTAGNVGIGTITPGQLLHVAGDVNVSKADNPSIYIKDTTGEGTRLVHADDVFRIQPDDGTTNIFNVDVVTNRVGILDTTPGNEFNVAGTANFSDPSTGIVVDGNALFNDVNSNTYLIIQNSGAATTHDSGIIWRGSDGSSNHWEIGQQNDGDRLVFSQYNAVTTPLMTFDDATNKIEISDDTDGGNVPSLVFNETDTGAGNNLLPLGNITFVGSDASTDASGYYASIEAFAVDSNSNTQASYNEGGSLRFNIWNHDQPSGTAQREKYVVMDISASGVNISNGTIHGGRQIFSAYDATSTVAIPTTGLGIPFDTELREDSYYTHATSGDRANVTISQSGDYWVDYGIGINDTGGSSRAEAECLVQVNGADVVGSATFSYHRWNVDGEMTNTGKFLVTTEANDKVQVECTSFGADVIRMIPKSSRLNIEYVG